MIAQGLRFYDGKEHREIQMRSQSGAPNARGVGKSCVFDRSRSLWLRCLAVTYENLCPSATVVSVHDHPLAEEYTVLSTTLLVVKFDDHSYGPVDINKVGCMKDC